MKFPLRLALPLLLTVASTPLTAEAAPKTPALSSTTVLPTLSIDAKTLPATYFPAPFAAPLGRFLAGDYEGTLADLTALERQKHLPPHAERLHFLRALCLQAQNDHQGAVNAFLKSGKLRRSNPDMLYFFAKSQLVLRNANDALGALQEAAWFWRSDGVIPRATLTMSAGLIQRALGDNPGAARAFAEALALDPNSIDAAVQLGSLNVELGKRDDALKVLKNAADRAPNDPRLKLTLAQALLTNVDPRTDTRQIDQAKQALATLITDAPETAPYHSAALPLMARAQILLHDGEGAQKTLTAFEKEFPKDPALPTLRDQLAIEREAGTPVPTPGIPVLSGVKEKGAKK